MDDLGVPEVQHGQYAPQPVHMHHGQYMADLLDLQVSLDKSLFPFLWPQPSHLSDEGAGDVD